MDSVPAAQNKEIIHFRKMNIFGYSGVGKSSLISMFEKFNDDNYDIKLKRQNSDISIDFSNNLVEQIKRVIIPINEDRNLNFLIYETNINHFDTIKTNLDTLLFQTECILIMWDNSNSITFDKIPDFITMIISMIKEKIIDKIDIYIIRNKSDLKFDTNEDGPTEGEIEEKIAELKAEYKFIYEMKTTLINKDDMFRLLLDIDRNYDKENFDENKAMSLVKIKYPFKSIKRLNDRKTVNICLVGDTNSGKSTFLKNLVGNNEYNKFLQEKEEPNYLIKVDDVESIIKITHIPGKDFERNKIELYAKSCNGFLLFLDVTKKDENFVSLLNYYNLIQNKSNGSIIIVANKIDLQEKREISKGKAKSFADERFCKYYECSSLQGINVLEIFNEIALEAYQKFNDLNLSGSRSVRLNSEGVISNNGENQRRKRNEGSQKQIEVKQEGSNCFC